MAEDKDKDKDKETPAPSGGGSKGPLILGALNTLLTAGVLALVLLKPNSPPPPSEDVMADGGVVATKGGKGAKADERGPMLRMSDFVIQLRNPEFDRYAKFSFQIECVSESTKSVVEKSLPEVRDLFISYLNDRTFEELRGSGGLERVKVALYQRLQRAVPPDTARALFITNFVVQ